MNKVFLIGNLVRDPELRTTQSGVSVCSFTIAVNRWQTAQAGQSDADYFRISAWRELGQNCAKYLHKGKKVSVVGSISASAYTGKDGKVYAQMDVNATDVEFLSPANQTQEAPPVHNTPPIHKADASGFVQVDDEDLPF